MYKECSPTIFNRHYIHRITLAQHISDKTNDKWQTKAHLFAMQTMQIYGKKLQLKAIIPVQIQVKGKVMD